MLKRHGADLALSSPMCANEALRLVHNPKQKRETPELQHLRKFIETCLDDEVYDRGLRASLDAITRFPERPTLTHSWALDFLLASGEKRQAIQVLEHGLQHGAWWSPQLFQTGWKGLEDQPELQGILEACRKRFEEETASAKAELIVRPPDKYQPEKDHPLLLILHGAYSNNDNSQHAWMSLRRKRPLLLAFLQSSQMMSSDHFVWDDEDRALRDVKSALSTLARNYRISRSQVILGGVSRGAEIALLSLFSGNTPADGFVSVIPSVGAFTSRFIKQGSPLTRKALVRGFIVAGEKDPRYPNTQILYKFLRKHGIACQFYSAADTGHAIPEDFHAILKRAVDFVLKK